MKTSYRKLALTSCLIFQCITFDLKAQTCEVFRENFNGSTTFQEIMNPYGLAAICAFANGAVFQNTGSEHYVTLYAYTESSLKKAAVGLPAGDYQISIKWKTAADPTTSGTGCTYTHFDDRFGASCTIPNRVFVVNNTMIHEKPGYLQNYSEVTTVNYSGKIDSIMLLASGGCSVYSFVTYYDYVVIKKISDLPNINFSYAVQDSVVDFSDSTFNAGVDTPLWNFGDGTTSTELNPQHAYPFVDSIYTVCLTRRNTCGKFTYCEQVQISAAEDTVLAVENDLLSGIRVYPNPAQDLLHFESATSSILDIYTIWGERTARISVPKGHSVIDIRPYRKGVYVLRTDKGATARLMLID